MSDKKIIYVLGVGGVGGYFGGKMARAFSAPDNRDSTFNVCFIARGTHLQEIKKRGLTLNIVEEKGIVCKPAFATDTIEDLPDPDVCFICVKSYDLDSLTRRLKEKIKKDTVIIPLLNGIDIYDRVKSIIGEAMVLPACVYIATSVERPGVVTQQGGNCTILLGRDPRNLAYDPEPIFDLLNRSGIKFKWYDDPFPEIWTKFIFIASSGMVTAFSKKTFGQILESPELKNYARSIMNEIYAIAAKKGVNLPSDIVSRSLEKLGNFPYDTMTSLQRDFALNPARHEGDIFGGTVIRFGRELGVPTPATESIYKKLTVI